MQKIQSLCLATTYQETSIKYNEFFCTFILALFRFFVCQTKHVKLNCELMVTINEINPKVMNVHAQSYDYFCKCGCTARMGGSSTGSFQRLGSCSAASSPPRTDCVE